MKKYRGLQSSETAVCFFFYLVKHKQLNKIRCFLRVGESNPNVPNVYKTQKPPGSYPPTMMNDVIEYYTRFCNNTNIDYKTMDTSLKKYIVVHQKLVNVDAVYSHLFGEDHINWAYLRQRNALTNMCIHLLAHPVVHWFHLLKMVSMEPFVNLPDGGPVFRAICGILAKKKIEDPVLITQLLLCKYLLYDTKYLPENESESFFIIKELLKHHGIEDAESKAMFFIAHLTDCGISVESHQAILCFLLSHCTVLTDVFGAHISKYMKLTQNRKDNVLEVRKTNTKGRISLLERQKQMLRGNASNGNMAVGATQGGSTDPVCTPDQADDFIHWCHRMRFPNMFSHDLKCQIYFMYAQPFVETPHETIPLFVNLKNIPQLYDSSSRLVQTPSIEILSKVISMCQLYSDPFDELLQFRTKCLASLPNNILTRLTINQIFQLYVCCYQHAYLWRDLWKVFLGTINNQIIKDVDAFVKENKFMYLHCIHAFTVHNT
jgi:hypothetical protein